MVDKLTMVNLISLHLKNEAFLACILLCFDEKWISFMYEGNVPERVDKNLFSPEMLYNLWL